MRSDQYSSPNTADAGRRLVQQVAIRTLDINPIVLHFFRQTWLWRISTIHHSFVTTAPPPTGKVWIVTFQFSMPCYRLPRGQTGGGGQNRALCPALHDRKSPWVGYLNIKPPLYTGYPSPFHVGGSVVTNDWCIMTIILALFLSSSRDMCCAAFLCQELQSSRP